MPDGGPYAAAVIGTRSPIGPHTPGTLRIDRRSHEATWPSKSVLGGPPTQPPANDAVKNANASRRMEPLPEFGFHGKSSVAIVRLRGDRNFRQNRYARK